MNRWSGRDRTVMGHRTPLSPAAGGWFDDPDQPKKKPAQSSRRSGAAICRPLRPLSEPLHDAVTPNRHDAVHSLRRITRRRSEKFSLKKPVAETLVSGPGW